MSLYKSSNAKAVALKSYDREMAFWPVEYEEVWGRTDYGMTHIIVSGSKGARPALLLPGLFADATMWYANVGAVSEYYRTYCLDQISY